MLSRFICSASIFFWILSCHSPIFTKEDGILSLPYLKNNANECYFLDDFMPVPNNLVSGKSGSTSLRYYTYLTANYKEWKNQKEIILSFYSNDGACWSLYEELAISD